jgi:hypothetical protein
MPVLKDYKCDDCGHEFESMEVKPLCSNIRDGHECGGLTYALPVGTKSYKIKGDNSASVTPKKHREQ